MTKYLFPAFIVVALIQLYVPAKMVWDSNDVVQSGTIFKFKTQPIDPNDPFRGKYVILNYEINRTEVEGTKIYLEGAEIFVELREDSLGFAAIEKIHQSKPHHTNDYVTASIDYASVSKMKNKTTLRIHYPFDRFYMEESKAKLAEETIAESSREEGKTAYAVVKVKEGQAVVEDVMVDGVSVKDMVENK